MEELDDGECEMEQEWRHRQRRFHTLGFREGVTAGKESSAQKGFNAGYCESIQSGLEWGTARGFTSAFAALPAALRNTLVPNVELQRSIESLHTIVASISSKDAMQSYYRHLLEEEGAPKPENLAPQDVDIWPIVSKVKEQAQLASINLSHKES